MKSCVRQLAPARFAAVRGFQVRRSFATASIQPYTTPRPPIGVPESDESLFSYTSGRWLYNESQQMAQRYTKFNVAALNRVISTVCDGASVVCMEKKEGVFNKSFIVTLTNGRSVVARIKNPVAGPEHLCTASGVATMDFTRNILGVPVPKVLAWSSQAATNGVGAEFIIMECAPGVQLSTVWSKLGARERKNVVNSVISVEQRLLEVQFSHYGSLYYKSDIPNAWQAPQLFADRSREDTATAKFCIGPSADRTFHEDERADMALDRGPWTDAGDYLRAAALREEAWIASHARPHMHDDPFRAVDEKALSSIIWHPDLNMGNIFVSPEDGYKVVSIIDWQGAWAGPAFLQMDTPAFVQYTGPGASLIPSGLSFPELPNTYEEMSPEQQAVAQRQHKDKMLQKLYEIKQLLPYHAGLGSRRSTLTLPVRSAGRTWKDGILPLQLALLNVAAQWPSLSTPDTPCPLRITRADAEGLAAETRAVRAVACILDDLRHTFGMRLYGWVSSADYGKTRRLLEGTMSVIDDGLRREMDDVLPGGWWPFKDTV
ncbi:kinase-like domain-containing protein [Roridomyces roridus]|uniref:Altered inheritance of mitochondria protein 9, mitochondrial n=1 Tax=Roridomyces roridus TaxID=1738132 RepID=A0AAD7C7V7_9AGAR|nr:kinase-like domain-containing protein [Roridomyces roridus]